MALSSPLASASEVIEDTLDYFHAPPSRRVRLRRQLGALVVDNFFRLSSVAGGLTPVTHPRLHGVEVLRDLPYREDSALKEHRLDVYRPRARADAAQKLPIVFYVHGGGFRMLSKNSHWVFGLMFARRGYLVFNISYRLAPRHPYPAAVEDTCDAFRWMLANAERFGGDTSRIAFAGESAGANLITSLALATCYRRPEPFARAVYDAGVVPKVVLPACGILQVSDPDRFQRQSPMHVLLHDRLAEVADAYFHGVRAPKEALLDLADPLLFLERGERPSRPLPKFFAPCGTGDPLVDDTRRLQAALQRLEALCETGYYDRGLHAFHAFIFLRNARRCWKDMYRFLERHL